MSALAQREAYRVLLVRLAAAVVALVQLKPARDSYVRLRAQNGGSKPLRLILDKTLTLCETENCRMQERRNGQHVDETEVGCRTVGDLRSSRARVYAD